MSPLPRDDRGSMPLALLLILVSVTLSGLMTPIVLTQVDATRTNARRVHALHAAQAGLDVAMAYIRAAQEQNRSGILDALPCRDFTGEVATGTARYKVTIVYYEKDPRDTTVVQAPIPCGTNGPANTPQFALLNSTGTETGGGSSGTIAERTLTATYIFNITNANIPGGLIRVYKDSSSRDLCLAADSGLPSPGTLLRVRDCDSSDPAQKWIYNQYLMITLASSRTEAKPLGMCVDMVAPPGANKNAIIENCYAVTQPRQQWSINDSANLQGTTDGINLNGTCLVVKNPNSPNSEVIGGSCGGPYNNVHTWSLEATVGSGAASADTGQVVNFSQFGRCMDITEVNVNKGYLIVWPCKQAPDPNKVLWNQRFTMPPIDPDTRSGSGRVTTTNPSNGVTYCLKTPGSTAPGRYVTVAPCPANRTDETTWTFFGHTTSYSTSYVLVDYRGYCMAPTDPMVDKYPQGQNVSKIVVQNCDGSTAQKWNAPPNVQLLFPLKDINED